MRGEMSEFMGDPEALATGRPTVTVQGDQGPHGGKGDRIDLRGQSVGDALPCEDLMAACEEVAARANAAVGDSAAGRVSRYCPFFASSKASASRASTGGAAIGLPRGPQGRPRTKGSTPERRPAVTATRAPTRWTLRRS